MFRSTTSRVLAGLGATAALVLAAPLAASAHVTVNPDDVTAGSYPTVSVRVPTESDTASTVSVEVTLPTDDPFLYVGYQPVPGWTIEVTTATLPEPVEVEGTEVTEAPATITFTADAGGGIRPGQFQEFPIVLGPVPEGVTQIVLPAVQTYDDGTVVEWAATPDEVAADESLEPAPVLNVVAASADGDDGHGDMAMSDDESDATTDQNVALDDSGASSGAASGAALGLGISGLVLGAIGAIAGVVALLRTRRTS